MDNPASNLPRVPSDAIEIRRYGELFPYLRRFAEGTLNLLLLLGRPGIGKTEAVREALGMDSEGDQRILYVEGHAQPFGLYQSLWEHRNAPVVLDDLDRLYANPECVRLLKPLCATRPLKRITWSSNAVGAVPGLPAEFTTTSTAVLVANEWRSLNANVRALEDRAIVLHFNPDKHEVHRQVATWFRDQEVLQFIGSYLPQVCQLSMRHYVKGNYLRQAGFADWRKSLLQMLLPDRTQAVIAGLQLDPRLRSDGERVTEFQLETGLSRATYFRLKKDLPKPSQPPAIPVKQALNLRLVGDE